MAYLSFFTATAQLSALQMELFPTFHNISTTKTSCFFKIFGKKINIFRRLWSHFPNCSQSFSFLVPYLLEKNIFCEGCGLYLYLSTEPHLCIWTSYFWTNINDSWNPIETATKCPFAIFLNLKCPIALRSEMLGEW